MEEIDSTNNYIKNESIPTGFWVLAKNQTAGRGRKDHTWVSFGSENIYFSAKVSLPENISLPLLSLLTAGAVQRTIQTTLYDKTSIQIKWPNDIYWNGKKIAGILLESLIRGKEITLIIGIGINLYTEKTSTLPTAGFLFSTKPSEKTKKDILNQLIENLNLQFSVALNSLDLEKELERIKNQSYLFGKTVQALHINETVQGRFSGYNKDGFLLIETDSKIYTIMDTGPEFRIIENGK